MNTLRSIWVWFAVVTIVIVALPTMAIVRLFDCDPAHYRTGRLFRWYGALATRVVSTWKIQVEGELPENPRRPYIFVGNHQSLADIPLISRLPWEMKWVIKIELFSVPLFGWLLRLSGDIPVDRTDKESRLKVYDHIRNYLDKDCSVMLFPEGTRSRDGRLIRFTNGAFRMAIQENVPVIPLVVDGTQEALPKHSWKLSAEVSEMRLKVLSPVSPQQFEEAGTMREHIRDRIAQQLMEWRGADRHEVDAMEKAPSTRNPSPDTGVREGDTQV